MWSSRPVCARPVRTLVRSALKASTLFFIFASVFFFSSGIIASSSASSVHQRALVLAAHHAPEGAFLENAEDVDRQPLVAAQGERGGVHDLEIALDGLVEADLVVAFRAAVLLRV